MTHLCTILKKKKKNFPMLVLYSNLIEIWLICAHFGSTYTKIKNLADQARW